MKGIEIKEFLRQRGWSVAKIAELIGESRQNLNNMLSKDDVRTGLVERLSSVTNIPLLEFYGAASPGYLLSGEGNVVNNGRDVTTADPSLVAVIQKQQTQFDEQQAQMSRLIAVIESLTLSQNAKQG